MANDFTLEWHGDQIIAELEKVAERAVFLACEHLVEMLKTSRYGRYPLKTSGSNEYARHMGWQWKSKGKNPTAQVGNDLLRAVYYEYGTGVYAEHGGRSSPWTFYNESTGTWWRNFKGGRPSAHMRQTFRGEAKNVQDIITNAMRGVGK